MNHNQKVCIAVSGLDEVRMYLCTIDSSGNIHDKHVASVQYHRYAKKLTFELTPFKKRVYSKNSSSDKVGVTLF